MDALVSVQLHQVETLKVRTARGSVLLDEPAGYFSEEV